MSQYRRRTLRTGLALLSLSASTALLPSAPAAAAPAPRADLQVNLTATDTMLRSNNSAAVQVRATVDNIGAAGMEDISIAFQLPAGSSIIGDPAWQCDYSTFVCTHIYGPVPAGGSAEPLSIHFGLPDGPVGTVATIGATVSTSAREVTRNNNTDQVDTTYGLLPDLSLLPGPDTGVWTETDISTAGGEVSPYFTVRNSGSGTAEDLRVAVEVPAGVTVTGAPSGSADWQCDFSVAPAVCVGGPLDPDQTAWLSIPMLAPSGTADERFSIRGTVTTSSPEWKADSNNVADVMYHYVDPA